MANHGPYVYWGTKKAVRLIGPHSFGLKQSNRSKICMKIPTDNPGSTTAIFGEHDDDHDENLIALIIFLSCNRHLLKTFY